jgi:hypothetical protein
MTTDHDFEAMLVAARNGEGWALTELYRVLYPRMVRYLGAVEPTEAEDVACDAWLDVVRGLGDSVATKPDCGPSRSRSPGGASWTFDCDGPGDGPTRETPER